MLAPRTGLGGHEKQSLIDSKYQFVGRGVVTAPSQTHTRGYDLEAINTGVGRGRRTLSRRLKLGVLQGEQTRVLGVYNMQCLRHNGRTCAA
jgi:hypothetical protein